MPTMAQVAAVVGVRSLAWELWHAASVATHTQPQTHTPLLEENVAGNLHDIGFGSDFLDVTPKV